jgi:hypothetical protein
LLRMVLGFTFRRAASSLTVRYSSTGMLCQCAVQGVELPQVQALGATVDRLLCIVGAFFTVGRPGLVPMSV